MASVASNDPGPLTTVQTTHGTNLAIATLADQGTVAHLRRWLDDGDGAVLRVNAAGILAKIPGQCEASRVMAALVRDADVRHRYITAMVARVCGLDWWVAAHLAENPADFPQLMLVAQRFAREAVSDRDAGARWCSAVMLLPPDTSDERWDVFLAALAEHLAARDGQGSPWWAESRSLRWWWFPFNTRAARVDALVHAPAAFRRRGVHVAAQELGVGSRERR